MRDGTNEDEKLKFVTIYSLRHFKDLQDKEIGQRIEKSIASVYNKLISLATMYIIMNIAFGYMLDIQDRQILELERQVKVLREEVHYASTLTETAETSMGDPITEEAQSQIESDINEGESDPST